MASVLPATLIDLSDYSIAPFDYEYRNQDDDFMKIASMAIEYDRIVLASPVYWYSPSATMKIFMDRLSDLLKVEKDMGRLLRSKRAALIATGSDSVPAPCFEECFARTYEYLGMRYEGMLYSDSQEPEDDASHAPALKTFVAGLHAE